MKSLNRIFKNKHTLIFVDFEGTQFTHEIIATGMVKAHIDDEGNIVDYDHKGLLTYTRPRSQIGKIVTKMTSITEEFLKDNGESWGETIIKINDYIGDDIDDAVFVCFGTNDPRMVIESNRFSHPDNLEIAKSWVPNFFDIMTFMSQYIRDEKGNTYSLVNFLKLFNIDPVGESHNPRNDAIDLMNLYQGFISNPDIVYNEYLKVLDKMKVFPLPVKEVIKSLLNGKDISCQDFEELVRKYLA